LRTVLLLTNQLVCSCAVSNCDVMLSLKLLRYLVWNISTPGISYTVTSSQAISLWVLECTSTRLSLSISVWPRNTGMQILIYIFRSSRQVP
jgi:hypothetical protein